MNDSMYTAGAMLAAQFKASMLTMSKSRIRHLLRIIQLPNSPVPNITVRELCSLLDAHYLVKANRDKLTAGGVLRTFRTDWFYLCKLVGSGDSDEAQKLRDCKGYMEVLEYGMSARENAELAGFNGNTPFEQAVFEQLTQSIDALPDSRIEQLISLISLPVNTYNPVGHPNAGVLEDHVQAGNITAHDLKHLIHVWALASANVIRLSDNDLLGKLLAAKLYPEKESV